MYRGRRILAIVPARGGSNRIPRKNVRPLAGVPLVARAIEAAAQAEEIDLCVVSTDDAETAAIARRRSARVIERPAALATAEARTEPALVHALDTLESEGVAPFDVMVLLEPTSPLRRPETVSACIRRLIDADASSLMTVHEITANLGRVRGGIFRPLVPEAPRRRQEREPFYAEVGVAYVCRVAYLRATGSLLADDWLAEVVSAREAIDINEPEDFTIAEALFQEAESSP